MSLLDGLVFFPDRDVPDPPPGVVAHVFTTTDGVRIHAWWAEPPDARATLIAENDLLPPVPAPVPTPVPAPAIVPPSQAFAAALLAEQMPLRGPSMAEVNVRFSGSWKAPGSPLRLTDRRV